MKRLVALRRDSVLGVGWDRVSTRLGIALMVVSVLFFAASFADKALLSVQVAQQKAQTLAQIAAVRQDISNYQHQLAYLHSRAYYVEAARAFGYVRPGDTQFAVSTLPPTSGTVIRVVAQAPHVPHPHHDSLLHKILQAIVPGL